MAFHKPGQREILLGQDRQPRPPIPSTTVAGRIEIEHAARDQIREALDRSGPTACHAAVGRVLDEIGIRAAGIEKDYGHQ
jgi:hypothetical protein